jgi:hypothetical protein
MTFLHFVNCAALAFLPPFIVYKSTKLYVSLLKDIVFAKDRKQDFYCEVHIFC